MAQRARFFAPLALAALSAVAALSLGRVVDSSRFVLPVLGAALLPHVLGARFRRRNWSVWIGVTATLAAPAPAAGVIPAGSYGRTFEYDVADVMRRS